MLDDRVRGCICEDIIYLYIMYYAYIYIIYKWIWSYGHMVNIMSYCQYMVLVPRFHPPKSAHRRSLWTPHGRASQRNESNKLEQSEADEARIAADSKTY